MDFVEGNYEWGYGPGLKEVSAVTHTRAVLFVKPQYWIVFDTLTPTDGQEHKYEAMFHLNAREATATGTRVSTTDPDANVHLLPAGVPDLTVAVVKGTQEEPVQGWTNGPWRAIPTALYHWTSREVTRQAFVMYPTPAGQSCPVKQVSVVPATTPEGQPAAALALRLDFADGSTHWACYPAPGAGLVRFGDYVTDGRAAFVALDAKGQPSTQALCLGQRLERK